MTTANDDNDDGRWKKKKTSTTTEQRRTHKTPDQATTESESRATERNAKISPIEWSKLKWENKTNTERERERESNCLKIKSSYYVCILPILNRNVHTWMVFCQCNEMRDSEWTREGDRPKESEWEGATKRNEAQLVNIVAVCCLCTSTKAIDNLCVLFFRFLSLPLSLYSFYSNSISNWIFFFVRASCSHAIRFFEAFLVQPNQLVVTKNGRKLRGRGKKPNTEEIYSKEDRKDNNNNTTMNVAATI